MIAIDTNLLVYAHRKNTPEHEIAKKVIESIVESPSDWGIPLPCVAEFWMVVTHPSCQGGASSPATARQFLEALLDSGNGVVWTPSSSFYSRFISTGSEMAIKGVRIFDLQIAIIALENGASQIWTNDKNFTSIPGLQVVNPL